MARAKWSLDDAARELMQLEPTDGVALKRLRDRLRRLADRAAGGVGEDVSAAAAALDGSWRLTAEEAGARLAESGRCIEAAMQRPDGDAEALAEAAMSAPQWSPPSDPVDESFGGMDPLMLAALAEFDEESSSMPAAESAAGTAPPAPAGVAVNVAAVAAPAWLEGADLELLDGFASESAEYLRAAESALLSLEAEHFDVEAVNTVFRCFHTIKGTAAFLGLESIAGLAHRAESLMSRVRDREIRLAGGFAELALRSVDVLDELVRDVRGVMLGRPSQEPADYAPLLASLTSAEAVRDENAASLTAALPVRAAEADVPPAAAAGTAGEEQTAESAESYMRVRTDRLDRVLDMIGELVISQAMITEDEIITGGAHDALSRKVTHAGKIVRELQGMSISMRMVPMKALFHKLARVCRDTAKKSGKLVDFVTEGEDTEIDRNMVDVIGDPLVHMVRNAVDHGVETAAERERAGKPARALVRLTARHVGGSVMLTLSDDGRGLDRARIMLKAVQKGLVDAERSLSDHDIHQLIFAAGFSTAEAVTDLSGRGVGMDVVRRSVEALRGRVEIESAEGRGSTFTIRLPLTLAITDGMLVRVGAERYILPTVNIQLSFRPEPGAVSTIGGRGELVLLRGDVLPIVRLHELLNVPAAEKDPTRALLVVVGSGERRCALLVDELLGQQQLVAKTLGQYLGLVEGISGGAILGDGRVGLILDVGAIVSLTRQGTERTRSAA